MTFYSNINSILNFFYLTFYRFNELCMKKLCIVKKCTMDLECPLRSRCHPKLNYCRGEWERPYNFEFILVVLNKPNPFFSDMKCQNKSDCQSDEFCEENLCVVSEGQHCRHHIHCGLKNICTRKNDKRYPTPFHKNMNSE